MTDNRNSGIFSVDPEGHASVLATGSQLGGPNGILLDEGRVSWVTFFGHEVKRLTRSGNVMTEAALPAVDVSALGLPPGVHSYAIIPIGYPLGKFGPVGRGPLPEIVYQDRWGQAWGGG